MKAFPVQCKSRTLIWSCIQIERLEFAKLSLATGSHSICGTSMRTRPPLLHTCRELKQKTSFALIKSKYRSVAAPPFVRTEFTKNERLGLEHSHNELKNEVVKNANCCLRGPFAELKSSKSKHFCLG